MNTSSAKAKGRRLQQHVVARLLETFPQLSEDDVRSCPMGSNGSDVVMSRAAKDAIGLDIECKARAGIALIYDALEQANGNGDLTPLAVVKADRKKALAVLDLEDLLVLLAAARKGGHE